MPDASLPKQKVSSTDLIQIAQDNQGQASRPDISVWVNASAGTGKTKVLTDRFLRLLLKGLDPKRILCLTFTRAAAQEMKERILQRTHTWHKSPENWVEEDVQTLLQHPPTSIVFQRARRLFPLLLNAAQNLNIQTLHAFCQKLLKSFPLESGVTPHFKVVDDTQARQLLLQARDYVLTQEAQTVEPYFQVTAQYFEELGFQDLLEYLINEKGKILPFFQDFDLFYQRQQHILGVHSDDTQEKILSDFHTFLKDLPGLANLVKAYQSGSPTDQKKGDALDQTQEAFSLQHFDAITHHFLKADGTPKTRLGTQKVFDAFPDAKVMVGTLVKALEETREKLKSLNILQVSHALLAIYKAILERYEHLKQKRGALDFHDLIEKTIRLFESSPYAQWVLYKIDSRIEHILVDEAQDTSALQWQVVEKLAEDFYSGQGQRETQPTLFVVGDHKQSIYSFQGANPKTFSAYHSLFQTQAKQSTAQWHDIHLEVSFRSTPAILHAVDAVFQQPEARHGVLNEGESPSHLPFRQNQGGAVEVWPLISNDHTQGLYPPYEYLARNLAKSIRKMLDNQDPLESQNRPITTADIMVLVQRRGAFSTAFIKACHEFRLDIESTQRMTIGDHILIKDIIALAQGLIFPYDDLNLATLLKGPFFNFTEDELFELCYQRPTKVWEALASKPGPRYQNAYAMLKTFQAEALRDSPAQFFQSLLGPHHGLKIFEARFGAQARDLIYTFLDLVYTYEQIGPPSLQGFLNWFEDHPIEIKQDIQSQTAIRLMTVHASKGLQAPIVFLPDTTRVPRWQNRILWVDDTYPRDIPVWNPPSKDDVAATRKVKHETQKGLEAEYRRLLYVAMTRAEDRLYVCGWTTKKETPENCWYSLIASGVQSLMKKPPQYGEKMVYTSPHLSEVQSRAPDEPVVSQPPLPDFFEKDVPEERPNQEVYAATHPHARDHDGDKDAAKMGTFIHEILERLKSPVDIENFVATYLQRQGVPELEAKIRPHIQGVVDTFPFLFQSEQLVEAPIAGKLKNQMISGKIDRIVLRKNELWVIDFKTDKHPPRQANHVSSDYRQQLAIYTGLVKKIFPHDTVRCFLLWTESRNLMEIFA